VDRRHLGDGREALLAAGDPLGDRVRLAHEDRTATLRSCYTRSIAIADEIGAETVAFPLVSSGAYGWPFDDAVRQALTALRGAETEVAEARLVLFGREAYAVAERVL